MFSFFFFSSRRRHTIFDCDWSSDVCSSDLAHAEFVHLQLFRALWQLLRRDTERIPRARKLPSDGEILRFRFRDLGPLSIATAQWQFFRRAGKPAGELLVQSLSDLYESHPDGHIKHTGGECEFAASLQLSARQRPQIGRAHV